MISFALRAGIALLLVTPAPCAIPRGSPAQALQPHAQAGTADTAALRKQIENGHAAQALVELNKLAALTPVPPEVLTLQGLAYYNQEKMQQADHAFAAALAADPGDREAAEMRGLTLFRMGKPADAIPLLERSASPQDPAGPPASTATQVPGSAGPESQAAHAAQSKADPHYVLALCYVDTRRYDDARHAFAAQYRFPPDSAAAYLLAARMLLRREYLPVAQRFAEQALLLDPQLPLAHALLGEIALGGNHLDEAISQFLKEQQRNPLEPSVYDRLGDAYSRSGDYADATSALQRAVLLEPHATGPYILLGKVMLKRQDAVGAVTYLERAKQMDPANFMTRNLLGQAYRAMGRQEEAAQELQAAQQLQAASEPKLAAPQ